MMHLNLLRAAMIDLDYKGFAALGIAVLHVQNFLSQRITVLQHLFNSASSLILDIQCYSAIFIICFRIAAEKFWKGF